MPKCWPNRPQGTQAKQAELIWHHCPEGLALNDSVARSLVDSF